MAAAFVFTWLVLPIIIGIVLGGLIGYSLFNPRVGIVLLFILAIAIHRTKTFFWLLKYLTLMVIGLAVVALVVSWLMDRFGSDDAEEAEPEPEPEPEDGDEPEPQFDPPLPNPEPQEPQPPNPEAIDGQPAPLDLGNGLLEEQQRRRD